MNVNRSHFETEYEYDGDPNTHVKAPIGSTCRDMSSGVIYNKTSGGSSASGWEPNGGSRVVTAIANYTVKPGDRIILADATAASVEIAFPVTAPLHQEVFVHCLVETMGVVIADTDFDRGLGPGQTLHILNTSDGWILLVHALNSEPA